MERRKSKAEPFELEKYEDFALTDLVIYALFSLDKKEVETTFENLTAECFELFPQKFQLPGYPDYPDARRVSREVRRLSGGLSEEKGKSNYLKGNLKTSFEFTEKGLKKLDDIQEKLKSGKSDEEEIKKRTRARRGKIEKVISKLQQHPLYQTYTEKGRKTSIPEHQLRDLLFATMETPRDKLREKMEIMIEYSDDLGREDVKEFLNYCKKKNKDIFK